jgi:formylmethanofuran dehydrogenase subunit C
MSGLVAELKSPLLQRADFSEVLAGPWTGMGAAELAQRPVYLERDGQVQLGDLFEVRGNPAGKIRFLGDLARADLLSAGMTEGEVLVEGAVGGEAGAGMAGGTLDVSGNAGPRAGAALRGFNRGMTGGELIVRGAAGPEAGALMRRGLVVIGSSAGPRAGLGMIAGSVVVFGASGADAGLWSKRGSVIALGPISPPVTYVYACAIKPVYLRLLFTRLAAQYHLPVRRKHLNGLYRRYSGDTAESGRGEILEWIPE